MTRQHASLVQMQASLAWTHASLARMHAPLSDAHLIGSDARLFGIKATFLAWTHASLARMHAPLSDAHLNGSDARPFGMKATTLPGHMHIWSKGPPLWHRCTPLCLTHTLFVCFLWKFKRIFETDFFLKPDIKKRELTNIRMSTLKTPKKLCVKMIEERRTYQKDDLNVNLWISKQFSKQNTF